MINNIFNYKRDLIINSINKISFALEQKIMLKKKYKNKKIIKKKYKCLFVL